MGANISRIAPKPKENGMLLERMRRKTENRKKAMMKRIEQYIYQIYLNFPTVDCVSIIISSELGHDAFGKFLSVFGDNEYLKLFHDANTILDKLVASSRDVSDDFVNLFKEYIFPRLISTTLPNGRNFSLLTPKLRDDCVLALKLTANSDEYISAVQSICTNIQSECISILSMNYFGDFLVSKQYTLWRSLESYHAIAASSDDVLEVQNTNITQLSGKLFLSIKGRHGPIQKDEPRTEPVTCVNTPGTANHSQSATPMIPVPKFQATFFNHLFSIKNRSQSKIAVHQVPSPKTDHPSSRASSLYISSSKRSDGGSVHNPGARIVSGLSYRAFINVEETALQHLLTGDNWIAPLLSASEGLPIGFTLCSAPRLVGECMGESPLLFVNKYFEKITGYQRRNILGSSPLDLLLCKQSSMETVMQVRDSSIAGQPITTIINCKKSNGDIFSNLISIKPVFSDSNRYMYLIAMYVDVTEESDHGAAKMRLAELLMGLLPDEIIIDKDMFTNTI